jgi:hypothetical protein
MRTAPAVCIVCAVLAARAAGQEINEPIKIVAIGAHRDVRVNGKPFFPIMSWLQDTERYPKLRALAINTFVGNHQGKPPAQEMADLAQKAGGYAVPHFDGSGIGHAAVLGWIQGDEPDLTSQVSDAKVIAGPTLQINKSAPLWKIVDGVTSSWSVLDPLEGASFTIELPGPVTVHSLAVWVTDSPGLSMPTEIVFRGDGKEFLRTAVAAKRGRQKFDLPRPATFRKLQVQIPSVVPGKNVYGSIGEIEAFDAQGNNVLEQKPVEKVRQTPAEVIQAYQRVKSADPGRPVFMTLTVRFLPQFTKFSDQQRKTLYPEYVQGADVVGFDVYPIYGWAKPEWLYYVAEGTRALVDLAGPQRPVYAWIETCKGTKYITYEKQKDVLPKHTRAEVWMAIIEGAAGIGYFTHAWRPEFTSFAPTEDMQQELARLNRQIARLAPAILAAPAKTKVALALERDVPGHCKATEDETAIYVFAQNIDMKDRAAKGTVRVAGLRTGAKVEVVDEQRTITAEEGGFTDAFDPLAEHIYRLPRD